MSMRKTFGVLGAASIFISRITDFCIRKTTRINITPIPSAAKHGRGLVPGPIEIRQRMAHSRGQMQARLCEKALQAAQRQRGKSECKDQQSA